MTNLATDLILGNIFLFQNNTEICYKPKQITILKDGFTQIIPMNKPWYLRLLTVESISTLTEKPIDFLEIRTTQVHNIKLLSIMDLNNKYDNFEIEQNYLSEIDNNFMLTKVRIWQIIVRNV